jgi:hypothetical protein
MMLIAAGKNSQGSGGSVCPFFHATPDDCMDLSPRGNKLNAIAGRKCNILETSRRKIGYVFDLSFFLDMDI